MGPRPPSSRGQDLDARTRGGGWDEIGVGLGGWGWLEEGGEGLDVFQLGQVGGGADDVFGTLAAQGLGG